MTNASDWILTSWERNSPPQDTCKSCSHFQTEPSTPGERGEWATDGTELRFFLRAPEQKLQSFLCFWRCWENRKLIALFKIGSFFVWLRIGSYFIFSKSEAILIGWESEAISILQNRKLFWVAENRKLFHFYKIGSYFEAENRKLFWPAENRKLFWSWESEAILRERKWKLCSEAENGSYSEGEEQDKSKDN